ncbi:MFS transporter [Amycolatopsis sp. NPDC059027]|uniref:MFS transporter n=1 Tax=Amycolatopsis sp. NPDC059027 TaxID=3346709 RepID=UPI00367112B4
MPESTPAAGWIRQPRAFAVKLGLANLGLFTALLTPALITLAIRIGDVAPERKEASLGLVTAVGALLALVANPLCGRLSDRTRVRAGRRRPWLAGGVIGGSAGLVIVALVPSVPAILVGWCLAQVSFNAALAALTATIPDLVPSAERGRVSGAMGFSQLAAVLLGAGVAAAFSHTITQLLVPALIGLVLVVLFAVTLPDRPAAPGLPKFSVREFLGSFWVNPVRHPDFGWAWLTRFLVVLGAFAPVSYLAFFASDRIGVPKEHVAATVGLLAMTTAGVGAVTAILGGRLSDRTGRRKPFVIGAALVMTLSGVIMASAHSLPVVFVAQVVGGLGTGMFYAVDLALVSQVLPGKDESGKDLGVINMANALPQSFGPALVPFLLAAGGGRNYTALYLIAAVAVLLGAVLVTRIKTVR